MSATWAGTGARRPPDEEASLITGQEQASRLDLSGHAVLTPSAVHVWAVGLRDFAGRTSDLMTLLPACEHVRAARYRFAEPRQRFIVGRWLLRVLLGRYLGEEAVVLQVEPGTHGKPRLVGPRGRDLRFSVAHSDALVVVAIAEGREVGVDIEAIDRDIVTTAVMRRFYSEAELRWLDSHPSLLGVGTPGALSLWTCKEAFGKALGIGLAPPILTLDEVLDPEGGGLPQAWTHRDNARAWAVCRLTALNGYAGALVVELPAGAASPVDLRQYVLSAQGVGTGASERLPA